VAVDREDLIRRGIVDPDASDAEAKFALCDRLLTRGAPSEALERNATNLGAVSADLNLRGAGPRLTFAQAAERQGVDLAQARRVWRALGFPDPPPDEEALTQGEAELLGILDLLAVLDPESALQLVRVIGSSVARMADAATAALRLYMEVPMVSAGSTYLDVTEAYGQLADTLLPQTLHAIDAILRRNIASLALIDWGLDPDHSSTTARLVVGFADMVGYTAMARSLSTRDLVTAIGTFEREVVDLVTDHGGRVVKLIGDEVMFVLTDPDDACRLAVALADRFEDDPIVPPLRVGLATGEVLTRDGDYYGRVVNAASRLVELADPGGVVVSDGVEELLGDAFRTDALLPTRVKGYDEPVQAFRLLI
jgi:adenylate cyclase